MQAHMRHLFASLLLAAAPAHTLAAEAQDLEQVLQGFEAETDTGELDSVLEGFEDAAAAPAKPSAAAPAAAWQWSGALTLSGTYNYAHQAPAPGQTDHRGLSRLRAKLNLELDGELGRGWKAHAGGYAFYDGAYAHNGREQYSDALLAANEAEAELGEAFVQGRLHPQVDLKLGRQIVVWGKSDNLRVTDVLNPMDNREPGLVDIEDLRLPLAMARLDYYVGDWGLSALAIPEIRFDKRPAAGSDFYAWPGPLPPESIPEDGGSNTEYALAANGIFSGWDLSFYWAQLFDDNPYLLPTPSGAELRHARLGMNGAAANLALGNWLLKAEAARLKHLRDSADPTAEYQRSDLLLGLEYSGFHDTTLSLELMDRHLHGDAATLAATGLEQDQWQTALRYSGDFLHARLTLQALLLRLGEHLDEGGFSRLWADYELRDALTLSGGLIQYHHGSTIPFNTSADNDRLFMDLKYSF